MEPTLVLGSAAVVCSLMLMWWAVTGRRPTEPFDLDRRPQGAGAVRDDQRERLLAAGVTERAAHSLRRFGTRLQALVPGSRVAVLARKLRSAGSPAGWTVDRVIAAKLLLAMTLGALLTIRFAQSPSALNFVLAIGAALFGFFIPDGLLDAKVSSRKQAVRAEVAGVTDQLAIMVYAGLSMDAAIVRCANTNSGPMGEELQRAVQDMRVGVTQRQALANLAERVDIPEINALVAALAQADRLGVPVSETLRLQAREMRLRQRQAAEEMAMKLPVKILFPMVLCIMPVIFIVLLGPAAISIFDAFPAE